MDEETVLARPGQRQRNRMRGLNVYTDIPPQLDPMGTFLHDLRTAVRGWRRRPGLALMAVLTLALGVGANAAIFSVLYAALLRALPFPEPERLMDVSLVAPGREGEPSRDDIVWSFPKAQTFMAEQRVFSQVALYGGIPMTLGFDDGAERVPGETVTGKYFTTLGLRPLLGRDFDSAEDREPAAPRAAILSYGLWQRRFGGDRSVLGRSIQVDGLPAVVIGIMPPRVYGLTGQSEVWINLAALDADELNQRWSHTWNMVARLARGVTPERAVAEVAVLGARVDAVHPPPPMAGPAAARWGATARPLDATRIDPAIGRSLIVLEVAVGLVLLIACANLANLFLTRAAERRREVAVRLAIGAGRRHLVRQFLTESGLLAVLAGLAGVGISWLAIAGLSRLLAGLSEALGGRLEGLTVVGLTSVRLDGTVLLFTLGVTVLTAMLVGILPAARATNPDLTESLKEGGLHGVAGHRRLGLRDGLVIAEVSLAVVLLAGAGLMLRTMAGLLGIDAGFEPARVLSVRTAIPSARYQPDSAVGFYGRLVERAAVLPGVEAAALGNCPPLAGGCNGTVFWYRDRTNPPEGSEPPVGVHHVSPDYFRTLGVPVLRGRAFTPADRRGAPKVVMINASAAAKFFPNEDPVGKPIAVGQGGFHDRAEIVGVVDDIRFGSVEEAPQPDVFIPYLQAPRPGALLYLRTTGRPEAVVSLVRGLIRELDPLLPVYDVRTMEDRVQLATARPRMTTWLLGAFAAAALLLAAVGVYGVIAYDVTRRTREIGVRMALGARPVSVLGLVYRRGLTLTLAGLAIGLAAALGVTRLLRSLLYGVEPADPATYAAVMVVLLTAAVAAIWLPARRATRVDPMEAIRAE
jgi:putative ABC transport system permease protein